MELYYKDLISEEASLEKLVDDLSLVVQGVDEMVQVAGANLQGLPKEEILSKLARLKQACGRLQNQANTTAQRVNSFLKRYPYSVLGVAFAVGLMAGRMIKRRASSR